MSSQVLALHPAAANGYRLASALLQRCAARGIAAGDLRPDPPGLG